MIVRAKYSKLGKKCSESIVSIVSIVLYVWRMGFSMTHICKGQLG